MAVAVAAAAKALARDASAKGCKSLPRQAVGCAAKFALFPWLIEDREYEAEGEDEEDDDEAYSGRSDEN